MSRKDSPNYRIIVDHYDACFDRYGATAQGVDWPNEDDLATRFDVMLGVIREEEAKPSLLDIGCGPGLLLDHISQRGIDLDYVGLDLSAKMIAAAKARHPGHRFLTRDLLRDPLPAQEFDYAVMNGVLTEKLSLSQAEMTVFAQSLIKAAFETVRVGLAFNVMTKHVDWERDDLFHWPFDDVARFLKAEVSRHVIFRADYGLWEYTVYVYRTPNRGTCPPR